MLPEFATIPMLLAALTPEQRRAVLASNEYSFYSGHGCTVGSQHPYAALLREKIARVARD